MNKIRELKGRKRAMYDALKSQLGVVTTAAESVGIGRTTHYLWMNNDSNYKKWVDSILDITLDFAENALFKEIRKGNTPAITFYLKTKGKNRGYIEKTEVEHSSNDFHIQVNIPESVKELFDE